MSAVHILLVVGAISNMKAHFYVSSTALSTVGIDGQHYVIHAQQATSVDSDSLRSLPIPSVWSGVS
jgi:hypothetical protein